MIATFWNGNDVLYYHARTYADYRW